MTPLPIVLPILLLAQAATGEAPAAGALAITERCDGSTPDEIVVCGRGPERSPYRLPPPQEGFDPKGPVDSVSRERHRLYEVGEAGIGSCSTVGAGGWTGCDLQRWKSARQQEPGGIRIGVKAVRKSAE